MGLRQDLRGAPQARHPSGRHHDQDTAATAWVGSGATTLRAHMGTISESTGRGIVATDLFTVETIWLKTLYVLFFIHLSTRQVMVAGVTATPDSA